MTTPEPGWYPDPRGGAERRWWNGDAWTSWLARTNRSPAPPEGGRTGTVASVPASAPEGGLGWVFGAVALGLVLVLAAVTAVGLQRLDAAAGDRPPIHQTDVGEPKVVAPDLRVDAKTGRVVIAGEIALQRPGKPYANPAAQPINGLTVASVQAQGSLYDKVGVSARSSILYGILDPAVTRATPAASVEVMQAKAFASVYAGLDPKAGRREDAAVPGLPGGVRRTLRVTFDGHDGRGVQTDELTIIVVPLSDGRQMVYLAQVPQRRDAKALQASARAAQASIKRA